MVEELLLRAERELPLLKEKATTGTTARKILPPPRIMDHPELSLGPSMASHANVNSSSESEASNGRKRKLSGWEQTIAPTNIDLQLNDPLPLDWEQGLDLQSGMMSCINKKTTKKILVKPKEKQLDFDLNISNLPASEDKKHSPLTTDETIKQSESESSSGGGGGGMVAIVCLNCYLLVMLYRSSPSCPNCKFMHSLLPSPAPQKMKAVKSLETLSLLH